MSNSPLVDYVAISPNRNIGRNHEIDTITIHCVEGQCSVETLGEVFKPVSRQSSSNYGIGSDGRIGMYCEEKDRSWCSSSRTNDNRAITIEVASDKTHPYAVNDKAYNALIKLLVDICKRNNIPELRWKGDKNLIGNVSQQNMTVHRWFANKSCPGEYLYERMGKIASDVNAILNAKEEKAEIVIDTKPVDITSIANEVISGKWGNGADRKNRLTAAGYDYSVIQNEVNRLLGVKPKTTSTTVSAPAKKDINTIVAEVIDGKWGNGADRKNRLTAAGYDYSEVQKKVNAALR